MPNPTITVGDDHKLRVDGRAIEDRDCVKDQRPLAPEVIVIHYTAGASASSSADSLADPGVQASAHLVVGREGELIQVTPFDRVAWHAGVSEYTFPDGRKRSSFNGFSIGIEIDNPGDLTRTLDGYQTWFGRRVAPADVVEAVHRNETKARFWHAYTELQIPLVERICRALIDRYAIKAILGHEEISPGRKTDPGPAFPLDKLRNHLLGANRRRDEAPDLYPLHGVVTASALNIRADASPTAQRVALPLAQGASVTALEERGGWYRVRAQVEGWVHGQHVDLERR